jgi:hypothetical protein
MYLVSSKITDSQEISMQIIDDYGMDEEGIDGTFHL